MHLSGIAEALLLKIRLVQERVNDRLISQFQARKLPILESCKCPVAAYEKYAYAITSYHSYEPPGVSGSLRCTESLWSDQIPDCIADVQDCENYGFLGVACCVGLC
jgi:hypothetical protein